MNIKVAEEYVKSLYPNALDYIGIIEVLFDDDKVLGQCSGTRIYLAMNLDTDRVKQVVLHELVHILQFKYDEFIPIGGIDQPDASICNFIKRDYKEKFHEIEMEAYFIEHRWLKEPEEVENWMRTQLKKKYNPLGLPPLPKRGGGVIPSLFPNK